MSDSFKDLKVFINEEHIADLELDYRKSNELIWRYTASWQEKGYPVSPHLPLNHEFSTSDVSSFLRNLLPEGHPLEILLKNFHLSKGNTFGLMKVLGSDLPGALIIKSLHSAHQKTDFRLIHDSEMEQRLSLAEHDTLLIWDGKPRLSVAGVQDKLNVIVNQENQLGFGEGELCSTHLLKFETKALKCLVLNEYISMRLAKLCGVLVANVTLRYFGKYPALLVERFDRAWDFSGKIKRSSVIDGCQALNLPAEYKYERNFGSGRDVKHIREGVSFSKLFDFANQCITPILEKQKLLNWALFNLLIANYDAHGKNVSFFTGLQGIRLAPFYDLVNVAMYDDLENQWAMGWGGSFNPDDVTAYMLADFSESCSLSRTLVARTLIAMIKNVKQSLESIEIPIFTSDDQAYVERYKKIVYFRCEKLLEASQEITSVIL